MLLPIIGLSLVLTVVGGLASLIAIADPHASRLIPYVGFISFFAGIGAFSFSMLLGMFCGGISEAVAGSDWLSGLGFLGGYVLGGFGGARFGFLKASRRDRELNS